MVSIKRCVSYFNTISSGGGVSSITLSLFNLNVFEELLVCVYLLILCFIALYVFWNKLEVEKPGSCNTSAEGGRNFILGSSNKIDTYR